MLIIFDVDGTLIDSELLDHRCFDEAFAEVTGASLTADTWKAITEITAKAIVHQALRHKHQNEIASIEDAIMQAYLRRLETAHRASPNAFSAFAGGPKLIQDLASSPNFKVGIATGCWCKTSRFKLLSAGYDLQSIYLSSSSDSFYRRDIIRNVINHHNYPLNNVVYVGDGKWDYKATLELGIPFIGTGHKKSLLQTAGARVFLESLSLINLQEALTQF